MTPEKAIELVKRYATGNVSVSRGIFTTRQDHERRREAVINYKWHEEDDFIEMIEEGEDDE